MPNQLESLAIECLVLAWAAACVFALGARQRGIKLDRRTVLEIVQAVVIVVGLFVLLTDGRGCSFGTGSTASSNSTESGLTR